MEASRSLLYSMRPLLQRFPLRQANQRFFSRRATPLRTLPLRSSQSSRLLPATFVRSESNTPRPAESTAPGSAESTTPGPTESPQATAPAPSDLEYVRKITPAYKIAFTCKPCSQRSHHRISQQGYHKGTVLIKCPKCESRHLISDHLKIFSDHSVTVEDLMRDQGGLLKKGTVGVDGNIEFWDDGPQTIKKYLL